MTQQQIIRRTAMKRRQRAEYRQRERNRRISNLFKAIAISAILLTLAVLWFSRPNVYAFETTTTHIVQRNDTLWNIAEQHSDHRHDTRQVVFLIQQLNDTSATIFPNQALQIPVFSILID